LNLQDEFVSDPEAASAGPRSERTFHYAAVLDILRDIDDNPHQHVSIQDFRISDRDIAACRKKIVRMGKFSKEDLTVRGIQFDRQYFDNAVGYADSTDVETITRWLDARPGVWSTTHNWFTVTVTNSKGDELLFLHHYYVDPKPWFLPWHVQCGNTNFASMNIDFSRLINEMIPDHFMFKEVFSNTELLYGLIENNYRREMQEATKR
jgi:hypothetical protein